MDDQNDFDRSQWDNRQSISRRPRDTRQYGSDASMGPEDYAFTDEEVQYDGRQAYYRSRPPARQAQQRRQQGLEGRRQDQQWEHENMANREHDDWAEQVRQNWQRGPYRDYGWESRESALPEFRDPSVHRTREEDEEMQEDERRRRERSGGRPSFRRAYDAQGSQGLPTGEMQNRYTEAANYGTGNWNVPGPHQGRGPRNYQRSNERIREDINDRLTQHGQLDATNIDVRVENGEVWLTGTVDGRRAKRLAEDVADSVTGVKDVHNELKIQQGNTGQAQP